MLTREPERKKHTFEAIFKVTAQVKSDGQGQRVFRVTEREAPANDAEFLSQLATMYQQEVCSSLRAGDDLTVAVRLDLPPRELEYTVYMREDGLFEGKVCHKQLGTRFLSCRHSMGLCCS